MNNIVTIMNNIVTIINDTNQNIYIHGDVTIGFYPSTSYTIVLNKKYYVSSDVINKNILGYIEQQNNKVIMLSYIIKKLTRSRLTDFITGKSGCSYNDFSQKYGIKYPLRKKIYLINDTPYEIKIFKIVIRIGFSYKPIIIQNNYDLAAIIPTQGLQVANLIPGSKLVLDNNFNTNDYFEIRDSQENCYGTFVPLNKVQYISDLTKLNKSTLQNYKQGKNVCHYTQYSGQYGEFKIIKWKIINDTGKKMVISKVQDVPNVMASPTF